MAGTLEVHFTDNPNGVFFPSQVVAGTVELRVHQAIKTRGLRLIVNGKAECKWVLSGRTSNSISSSRPRIGEEKFLESETFLLGSANGDLIEVPTGVHTYNFECKLPEEVPYSVASEHGNIAYKVDVSLVIPWGEGIESAQPFTVVRHDDLNQIMYADCRVPVEVEEIKTFCCLFCKSGPLIIRMQLPKTGFALGEKIPIHVEMDNKSTTNVSMTQIFLKKIEEFHSNPPLSKTKSFKSVITSTITAGVEARKSEEFDAFLEIPQILLTSNDRLCKVFVIKYYLNLKAHTPSADGFPDMDIFITIGHVGIVDVTTAESSVYPTTLGTEALSAPSELLPLFDKTNRNYSSIDST